MKAETRLAHGMAQFGFILLQLKLLYEQGKEGK